MPISRDVRSELIVLQMLGRESEVRGLVHAARNFLSFSRARGRICDRGYEQFQKAVDLFEAMYSVLDAGGLP